MKRFRAYISDPPWKMGDQLPGPKRGASKFYKTMSVAEIEKYPVPPMVDDSILFLWRVAAMPDEALRVVRAWGFTPKTEIVWVKLAAPMRTLTYGSSRSPEEWLHFKLAFGMGHFTRAAHETCIVATKGRFKVADRGVRSVFFAPRGQHSEKPFEFYDLVEKLVGEGPYVESFARRERANWTQFGDQLPGRPASPPRMPSDASVALKAPETTRELHDRVLRRPRKK